MALLIIEQVRPESDHQLGIDVSTKVVDDRILGRSTAKDAGVAECAVGAEFRRDRIGNVAGDIRHIAFIHVPSLSRGMPFAVELVVPGEVIVLQVVIGILAVVDAVRASVKLSLLLFVE